MALVFVTAAQLLAAAEPTSDALIKTLVQKGILTEAEAKGLLEEASKESSRAVQVKTGLPDWVTSLKINGDVRGRFEMYHTDNPEAVDRNRFRYRARLGFTAILKDHLEAGFRLSSGESAEGFGSDPISDNATFQNNAAKKFVWIDRAYGKWMTSTGVWETATTVGKMDNPLMTGDLLFDVDYAPEGLAQTLAYNPNEKHSFKLNLGGFALDEYALSSHDPYLFGAQARWDGKWNKQWQSSLAVATLAIHSEQSLTNGAVPNINRGNTRLGPTGILAEDFNPVAVDAALTYHLESFPGYNGPFPVRFGGSYLNNVAASDKNQGFSFGPNFGKSGKKGNWEFSYRYRYLGGDAQYEELVDLDYAVYYERVAGLNYGGDPGFSTGTNHRGHIFRVSYSPYDSLTLAISYMRMELIDESPNGSDSEAGHLQVDAVWKF